MCGYMNTITNKLNASLRHSNSCSFHGSHMDPLLAKQDLFEYCTKYTAFHTKPATSHEKLVAFHVLSP
jgi:hypothetical protein